VAAPPPPRGGDRVGVKWVLMNAKKALYLKLAEKLDELKMVGHPMFSFSRSELPDLADLSSAIQDVRLPRREFIVFSNSYKALIALASVVLEKEDPAPYDIYLWINNRIECHDVGCLCFCHRPARATSETQMKGGV